MRPLDLLRPGDADLEVPVNEDLVAALRQRPFQQAQQALVVRRAPLVKQHDLLRRPAGGWAGGGVGGEAGAGARQAGRRLGVADLAQHQVVQVQAQAVLDLALAQVAQASRPTPRTRGRRRRWPTTAGCGRGRRSP